MCAFPWSAGSSGLCVGQESDLHNTQRNPRELSMAVFPVLVSLVMEKYLSGFKNPVAFPVFVYLVPPAEAHHQSSSDVLSRVNTVKLSAP